MTIRYILCSFGTFFPVWVIFTKKNMSTPDVGNADVKHGAIFFCFDIKANFKNSLDQIFALEAKRKKNFVFLRY
jgi:hypothetical protein